jgi:hypothetical protein
MRYRVTPVEKSLLNLIVSSSMIRLMHFSFPKYFVDLDQDASMHFYNGKTYI